MLAVVVSGLIPIIQVEVLAGCTVVNEAVKLKLSVLRLATRPPVDLVVVIVVSFLLPAQLSIYLVFVVLLVVSLLVVVVAAAAAAAATSAAVVWWCGSVSTCLLSHIPCLEAYRAHVDAEAVPIHQYPPNLLLDLDRKLSQRRR